MKPYEPWVARVPVLFALALLVEVFLVRGPYLRVAAFDGDEALFWLIGNAWLHGHLPYTRFWDLKPPGLYALFALTSGISGTSTIGPKMLCLAAVWATALSLNWIGGRQFGKRASGWIAAAIYPPFTLLFDGLASKPELLMAPLIAWGAGATLTGARSASRLWPFAAGLALGFAATIKQTGFFEAIFFLLAFAAITRSIARTLSFFCGVIFPTIVFSIYFAANGLISAMLDASFVDAASRAQTIGVDGVPIAFVPIRFVIFLARSALPLLLCIAVLWLERRRLAPGGKRLGLILIIGWLATASLGALVLRATYESYLQPLLAPLCLLAGVTLAEIYTLERRDLWTKALAIAAVAIAVVYPVLLFQLTPAAAIAQSNLADRVANYVRERAPGRSIYVVDYEPVIYQMTGATVPTRYPLPMQLLCPSFAAKIDQGPEIRRIMSTQPALLIVSASRARMVCEDRRLATMALTAGHGDYRMERTFSDTHEVVEVWARRDLPQLSAVGCNNIHPCRMPGP